MSNSTPQRTPRKLRKRKKQLVTEMPRDGFSSEEDLDTPDDGAGIHVPEGDHGTPQNAPAEGNVAYYSPGTSQSSLPKRNADDDPLFLRSMSETTFTCGCCYELMIQPTTLNCGHSFCRVCLARWWKAMKKMTCPGCRQPWSGFPHINIILR